MYVGRIVSIGMTPESNVVGMYRVSSRSFPNRHCVLNTNSAAIVPKPGHESDIQKSPYIAYNCLRTVNEALVVTNGAHTDPITEKLAAGLPPRDALVTVLHAMDYEHDAYNTPRIAGIVERNSLTGYLGIVRHDAVLVKAIDLTPGCAWFVCTYERNGLAEADHDDSYSASTGEAACDYILGHGVFAEFERPVSAVAGVAQTGKETVFSVASVEASQ